MSPMLCWLTSIICSQSISSLKDEIRELKQKIQNQDSTISSQTLENQELQEQLDLQRRYSHIQRLIVALLSFVLLDCELCCMR